MKESKAHGWRTLQASLFWRAACTSQQLRCVQRGFVPATAAGQAYSAVPAVLGPTMVAAVHYVLLLSALDI